MRLLPGPGPDLPRHLGGVWDALQVLAHIEIGLVQRQRLHKRSVLVKNLPDLARDLAVDVEPRLDEDKLWAFPTSRDRGHGRMHPEAPGLVTGSRDDAPLTGAADGDRPT